MGAIAEILLGVGFVVFVLDGIFCMLLIKGSSAGIKEKEDEEQERWIQEYRSKHISEK